MKTREWDRHVAPRLLEALPDGWSAHNGHLSTVAADGHLAWHISRQVSRSGGFELHAVIQPLYIYSTVLVGNFDEILGHGVQDVRSFFTADTPGEVPVDEIVALAHRFAFPYFERYGTDLRSFLALPTGFARSLPGGRGTWTTEAWAAGAYSLLVEWAEAGRAWADCLTELAYFDADLAPETRRLAAHGADADDSERRSALVARLLENEDEMREVAPPLTAGAYQGTHSPFGRRAVPAPHREPRSSSSCHRKCRRSPRSHAAQRDQVRVPTCMRLCAGGVRMGCRW